MHTLFMLYLSFLPVSGMPVNNGLLLLGQMKFLSLMIQLFMAYMVTLSGFRITAICTRAIFPVLLP